jgi:hypothetical protein
MQVILPPNFCVPFLKPDRASNEDGFSDRPLISTRPTIMFNSPFFDKSLLALVRAQAMDIDNKQ